MSERGIERARVERDLTDYDRATELVKAAMATGRGITALVCEKKLLTEEPIAEILDPAAMTGQARSD